MPVNESKRVLFAFLKDPLKINGILSFLVISFICLAIVKDSFKFSIIHGPAIKKNVFLFEKIFSNLSILKVTCKF